MIYRKQTRTLYQADNASTLTEVTEATQRVSPDTLPFVMKSTGFLYVGFVWPFCSRYFSLPTPNGNSSPTLSATYWNGSSWSAVLDLQDQTSGFTRSGFIAWSNQTDWAKQELSPVSDTYLYWMRLATSADLLTGTVLDAVANLFCDDNLLREYYPELISDSRFLPSGQTNFIPQYGAAKDLVVRKLIQKRIISEESNILDINEVAIAAVHATAWIIFNPIASSDEARKRRDDAWDAMVSELNDISMSPDVDHSGTISVVEDDTGPTVFIPRW